MSENGLQTPLTSEKPRGNRWHWFRLYMDIDKFTGVLNSHRDVINHAHYILHDNDKLENSDEFAKPHIHCLMYLYDYKTTKAISKWFPDDCGFRAFNIREPPIAMRYLIHLGFNDKFQYSVDEVLHIGSTAQFYKALSEVDKSYDTAVSALHDLLTGASVYDCCIKYGKDFIYHIHSFEKAISYIGYIQENEEEKKEEETYQAPLSLFDSLYDDVKKGTENVPF